MTQIYVDLKLKFDQYAKLYMFIAMSVEYWLACEPAWHRGELIYEKKSNRELIYEKKSSRELIYEKNSSHELIHKKKSSYELI